MTNPTPTNPDLYESEFERKFEAEQAAYPLALCPDFMYFAIKVLKTPLTRRPRQPESFGFSYALFPGFCTPLFAGRGRNTIPSGK